MSIARKIIYSLAAVVLVLVLASLGLDWWIGRKLPEIISRENDTPYRISYKNIDVSLLTRTASIQDVDIVPKEAGNGLKEGIYANVESVVVDGINITDLIFTDRIKARTLTVTSPKITFVKGDKKDQVRDANVVKGEVVEPFRKIIYVTGVIIRKADVRIIDKNQSLLLLANNLWVETGDVVVTEQTLDEKIPFRFSDYTWSCDSVFYRAGTNYNLTAGHVSNNKNSLLIRDLHFKPRLGKDAFTRRLEKEKDRYDVRVSTVKGDSISWGFEGDRLFVHTSSLEFHQLDGNVFRSKLPPDDMTRKKLYSEMLRTMKQDIQVKALKLIDSRIQYEEEKDKVAGTGKVFFSNFYLTAHNVRSGINKKSLPDVSIDVKCRLMGSAPMEVNWKFNTLDPSDAFNIRGRVFNFPAERLQTFSRPYMNAKVKGELEEIYFNFDGNRETMRGDFAINFEDIKVTVYRKKDRDKKNKIVTALANLFVKNDTKDKVETAEVAVDRIKEKSFFNLLWRGVFEGLKKTLI